jgi:hypothetical protein
LLTTSTLVPSSFSSTGWISRAAVSTAPPEAKATTSSTDLPFLGKSSPAAVLVVPALAPQPVTAMRVAAAKAAAIRERAIMILLL